MAQQVSGRRIFLASPGGLEMEREAIRAAIARFNEENAFESGVAFVACGWEVVAGSAVRPQELINPLLRECDFMLLLLHDRWGSPPGGEGNYESGTEEEVAVAQQALADTNSPLRDILVIFKAPSAAQMRDPGPQLSRVLAFREHLECTKQVLFQVVDTGDEILERLRRNLRQWAQPIGAAKQARAVSLRPTSLGAVQSALAEASLLSVRQLVERAEQLANDGLPTQAEAVFSNAIKSSDADAMLRFARFLRRTGRLQRSYEIDEDVVRATAVGCAPLDAARSADALANMGVVRRKQGRLRESAQQLDEAVRTARKAGLEGRNVLAYALDNLAWTRKSQGDLNRALAIFEESRAVRVQAGDLRGEAASLVNVGRLALAMNRVDDAATALERASQIFDDGSDESAHANALVALAEVRLAQQDVAEARRILRQAKTIDERLGHLDGISVTCNVLARCALADGDLAEAAEYGERCRQESARSGNQEGLALALQLIGRVNLLAGRPEEGIAHLRDAAERFNTSGDATRESRVLIELASALLQVGRSQDAREAFERARRRASYAWEAAIRADMESLERRLGA